MKLPIVSHSRKFTFIFSIISFYLLFQPVQASKSVEDFFELDLESLLSMEVTSVSKKKQPLTDAAAAVYVISQEDIRRSGVTSIPEALRMAPGVQVARIDGSKWAITTRGFNGQFANKLLVLIDGRSVYTPAFSGVYWDMQDTLMEDIERIEIIRGPGATLWGANAVNGVINIITKNANKTQGGLITLGGGEQEKGFINFRYGLELDENFHGRFYAKAFERDSNNLESNGNDAHDSWESLRSGFRVDGSTDNQNSWTLQGDIFDIESHQFIGSLWTDPTLVDPANIETLPPGTIIPTLQLGVEDIIQSTGWNLLVRWNHQINNQSSTSLQIYLDNSERKEIAASQIHDTLDIDFQHNLSIGEQQEMIWGLGYRRIKDEFGNTFALSLAPDHSTVDLLSAFIQDQIELIPESFFLTIGSKFEHNDYTGSEVQPSIRGLWKPDAKSSLWGAVSRAVRTPSRIETSGQITTFAGLITTGDSESPVALVTASVNGNNNFESEKILAYELGYRIQPRESLSIDLAAFYNEYDNLLTYENIDESTVIFDNMGSGHASGLEAAIDWHPESWWRLQASYSMIKLSLDIDKNSRDTATSVQTGEGSSPEQQLSLRSTMNLNKQWELDFWVYYVDEIPTSSVTALRNNIEIDSYTSLNARLGWWPEENMELSLVILNLQSGEHTEFVGEFFNGLTEIKRTVYAKFRWDF